MFRQIMKIGEIRNRRGEIILYEKIKIWGEKKPRWGMGYYPALFIPIIEKGIKKYRNVIYGK